MRAALVLIICLISCLSVKQAEQDPVDPKLHRFIEAFLKECNQRRKDCQQALNRIESIKILDKLSGFEPGDEGVIGRCYIFFRKRKIEILREVMVQPDKYIKALLYHEIGHCGYDLEHVPEEDTLMSEHMPGMPTLVFKWKELMDGFFAEIRKKNGD